MKKFFTAALLISAMASATAQEVVFDVVNQTNFRQCTMQSLKYDHDGMTTWSFYSSYVYMYNWNISNGYWDDFLITPDLALEAGNQYAVQVTPSMYSSTTSGNLDILVGQGDDLSTYTTLQQFLNLPYGYDAPTHEVRFVVPESGNYRVSFRGYPNQVKMTKAQVVNYGQSAEPAAPSDFAVVADPEGALKVEVSFTMPGVTLTGQALDAPAYNLYRGVQKIKNGVAAAAGEKVVYTENRGEAGMVNYSVEIVSGENVSEKISAEAYVGLDTATPPTDVNMSLVDGKYLVTWIAPTEGVHGAPLLPEKLTYTVTRILDDQETVVAKDMAGTSFADEFDIVGLHKLKYSVSAKYAAQAKATAAVESDVMTIGSIDLPFADSFAGATMNPNWENKRTMGTYDTPQYYWQAVEKSTRTQDLATPYDEDGGMGFYNSYNNQRNNGCRLATPPVSFKAGDNPVFSFARYQMKLTAADILKAQISIDYGEWTDIPGASYTAGGAAEEGWKVENLSLIDLIPAGTTVYQVALTAESMYGQNLFIDAVRLFNLMEKDLSIDNFTVSEVAHAGKTLEIEVKVANNGASEVKAADYSVEIDHDFTEEFQIDELQDIPSLASVSYKVSVPVSSLHIHEVEGFEFTAKVKYEGDQTPENNISETLVAATAYGAGASATQLEGTKDQDGNITLQWKAAKDLDYVPVNIFESFEDESFEEDFTGPFNGWVTVDLDGKSGGTWYSASGSQFNLAKNAGTPGNTKDGSNVLGVTVANNAQQDDWIISPALSCKAGSTMNLSFLWGLKQTSSYGNNYKVELLYTTDDAYDILNPQNNFTNNVGKAESTSYSASAWNPLPQDNKMYEVSFSGIPAEAKYIALHFATKGSYTPAMWVDKIQVTENDENALLGYHIYSLYGAGRLNDELISADEDKYELGINADEVATFSEERNVFVTAVYPDGEAMPSNLLDLALLPTGVENVSVDAAPADASVEYFDLQGRKVAAGKVTPGIYIIRAAGKTSKVVIR